MDNQELDQRHYIATNLTSKTQDSIDKINFIKRKAKRNILLGKKILEIYFYSKILTPDNHEVPSGYEDIFDSIKEHIGQGLSREDRIYISNYDIILKDITEENNEWYYESLDDILTKMFILDDEAHLIIEFINKYDVKTIKNFIRVEKEQLNKVIKPWGIPRCKRDVWFCEIRKNDQLIISVFVYQLEPIDAQVHGFIVKDLRTLIKKEIYLKYASIFLHSFASSLFGNDHWYTKPIGNMSSILKFVLGERNICDYEVKFNGRNRCNDEMPLLINQEYSDHNGCNFLTEINKEITINDYLKNVWKTSEIIKKQEMDKINGCCELGPLKIILYHKITDDVKYYILSDDEDLLVSIASNNTSLSSTNKMSITNTMYQYLTNMFGGSSKNNYHEQKYNEYKKKYLELLKK